MLNQMKLIPLGLLPLTLAQFIAQKAVAQPQVPDTLKPPAGQILVLKANARGTQIYQCSASSGNSNQFEWQLKAPAADLLDDKGQKIGQHFAGPTWKAIDGSSVVGQVKAKANAPSDRAIPWLLLTAKTHQGTGIFSPIASIQRVDTQGGVAPKTGCNATTLNTEVKVGYQATYYFYREPVKARRINAPLLHP
jgi:hypothetical protein